MGIIVEMRTRRRHREAGDMPGIGVSACRPHGARGSAG
jgi:hypothetical protein